MLASSDLPNAQPRTPNAGDDDEGGRSQELGEREEKQGQNGKLELTTTAPHEAYLLKSLLELSFREEGSVVDPDALAVSLCELTAALYSGVSTVWRAVELVSSPIHRTAPVGMIEVRYQNTPPIGPHYMIGRLVVHQWGRNGRVARALIEAAIRNIPEEEAVLLTMVLGPMRRSYRTLGAREVGTVCAGLLSDVRRRLNKE